MIDQQPPRPAWDPIKILQLSNPDVQGWTCKGAIQSGRRCRRFLGQANRDAIETIMPKISPLPASSSNDKPSTTKTADASPPVVFDETRQLNTLARCCLCHVHDDDDTAKDIALGWVKDLAKARSVYVAERKAAQFADKPSPKSWNFTFTPGPVSPLGGGPPNGIPTRTTSTSAFQPPSPSPAQAQASLGYLSPNLKPPATRTTGTPVSASASWSGSATTRGRQSLSPGAASPTPSSQTRRRAPTPGPTPQDKARAAGVNIKQEQEQDQPQSILASQPKVSSPTSFSPTPTPPRQSIFGFQSNISSPTSFTPTPPKSAFTFQSPPLAQAQTTSPTSTPTRSSSLGFGAGNGAGLKSPAQRTSLSVSSTRIKQEKQKPDEQRRTSRNHFYYDPTEDDGGDERSKILDRLKEQEDTLRRFTRQHSELIERLEGMNI